MPLRSWLTWRKIKTVISWTLLFFLYIRKPFENGQALLNVTVFLSIYNKGREVICCCRIIWTSSLKKRIRNNNISDQNNVSYFHSQDPSYIYVSSVMSLISHFHILALRITRILFAFPQTIFMTPQLKHFNLKLAKVLIPDITQEIII